MVRLHNYRDKTEIIKLSPLIRLTKFGEMLNKGWELKKQLSKQISNEKNSYLFISRGFQN